MAELVFAGVLVLIILGLSSKYSIFRTLTRIFTGLVALASATAVVLLFMVGQKAHWTSDGPGMLMVMIGIFLCGLSALLFGQLFLMSFTQSSSDAQSSIGLSHGTTPPRFTPRANEEEIDEERGSSD